MKISEEQIEQEAKNYAEFVESPSLDTLQDFKSGAMWMQSKIKEFYKWKDPSKQLPIKSNNQRTESIVVEVKVKGDSDSLTAWYDFVLDTWVQYTTFRTLDVIKWRSIM